MHWNRYQRSRVILMLSRLLLVPDESLWKGLVSGLLSQDGHITLPEAAQRSADIAHTAGTYIPRIGSQLERDAMGSNNMYYTMNQLL